MSIGLRRGTVSLSNYDKCWIREFKSEKERLLNLIGPYVLGIEHIGSTSIPNLDAKPIIDILIGIKSLKAVNEFIAKLKSVGYEYMPERITEDRAFFPKGPRENRTHYLSIVEMDSNQWRSPIIFRDCLRDNIVLREEYCSLKKKLADKHKDDRYSYTDGKEEFIKSVLSRAGLVS